MFGPDFPILGRLLRHRHRPQQSRSKMIRRHLPASRRSWPDRVPPCPNCGGDPNVCRTIGCDVDDAPLLLAQPKVDRSEDMDEPVALIA